MNEGVEEPKTEDLLEIVPDAGAVPEPSQPAATGPFWLRLAYVFEFLVALVAAFIVWSEVGGQGHLDLLPWHIKLVSVMALAWCCVRFSAGIVEEPKAWNGRTVRWLLGMVLIAVAMGGITYYYHLHEIQDDSDEDSTAALLIVPRPASSCLQSDRTSG